MIQDLKMLKDRLFLFYDGKIKGKDLYWAMRDAIHSHLHNWYYAGYLIGRLDEIVKYADDEETIARMNYATEQMIENIEKDIKEEEQS